MSNRVNLTEGSWFRLDPEWIGATEGYTLMQGLYEQIEWEQRHIVLFGRSILQPRLIAWAGAVPYRYSGQTLPPRPIPAPLAALLREVNDRAEVGFNHVLLNRYRNGNDSMGLHADDEPELGPNPVLASVSLGVARRFVIQAKKPKASATPRVELLLGHGSLLIMGGAFQHEFRHGIPKQPHIQAQRLNLTFRRIQSSCQR